MFERHLEASEEVPAGTDLVVWPEDVVDLEGPLAASPEGGTLAALARELGATLVVGVTEQEGNRFRNAAVAYDPDGTVTDRYEKVRRVPFGEYVPLRALLDAVRRRRARPPATRSPAPNRPSSTRRSGRSASSSRGRCSSATGPATPSATGAGSS